VRFLYKIYSGYDGFTPWRIPDRLQPKSLLRLGWTRYLDSVGLGDEVWVYFHGPHRFQPGVYVQGFVRSINAQEAFVLLRVREYDTTNPLTDPGTSVRIAQVVAPRRRQVFVFPPQWVTAPHCTLDSVADSCRKRMCGTCPTWRTLPLIAPTALARPARLPHGLCGHFVPAYWVIPRRCYLHYEGTVSRMIGRTSDVFMRFKVGEEALAFLLALGIYEALRQRELLDFDCIVPIPLSPDKEASGEIHRTRLLARELGKLLGIGVAELLTLRHAISKRRLRTWQGCCRSSENVVF